MSPLGLQEIDYPEALAAIGRLVNRQRMTAVTILEFENGMIVTGSVLYETGESYNRRIETHVLSADDLRRLIKER